MHRKSFPPLLIALVLVLGGMRPAPAQARIDTEALARGLTLTRDSHLAEPYDPAAPLPSPGDPGLRPTNPGRLEKAGGPGERWQYTFPSAFVLDRNTGPVSLYLGPCDYPFELSLNGVVIHSGGFHQTEGYVSSIFKAADLRLPEALLRRDGSVNVLALRVYPELGDEDFPPPELVLMEPRKAAGIVFVRNMIRVQLIGAATFTALLLAFYFLLLGLSGRALDPRARSSYLFFALLCLAFFAAYAEIVFQTDAIDEVLIKKTSKIGFAAMLFAFPAFVAAFTGRPRRIKLYLALIALPALGFSALFFVQPTKSAIDAIFAQVMILDFGLGMLSSLVFLLIAVLKDRARGAGSLLGGIAFVLVASVLDLLSLSSGTLPYAYYTPYGFLAVVVVIFVVLARDQVRIAEDSRRQAAEIESAARAQEELIARVRELSGRIVESGKELEASMGEAERVIAESSSEARSAAVRAGEKARDAGRVATLLAEQIERSAARIPEAVRGQTGFVARVTTTISAMNERIGELAGEATEGAASAESLAATGDEAARSVAESRRAAQSIAEASTYVREVIGQVGDIADKTNTLAINTAIEAARAGSSGKGFAVIAQAIRGLAAESTERIGASSSRLAELEDAVLRNQAVQAKVDEGLGAIIARGRDTAGRIARISEGILARREESSSVLAEAQRLLEDTRAVESLFNQALQENAEARTRVSELARAFIEMEKILGDQADRVARLESAVGAALRIAAKDRETVTALDAVLAGAR